MTVLTVGSLTLLLVAGHEKPNLSANGGERYLPHSSNTMNPALEKLRAENIRKKELDTQAQLSAQQVQAITKLESRMVTAIESLIRYLNGKTTKTEVVNQLESIGTPDALKVVKAVNDMHSTLKKHKNTDLTKITAIMNGILKHVAQLPKELPTFEAKEAVSITNLPDFDSYFTKLEQAVAKLDVKPEVKVAPTPVTVEAPIVNVEQDFATLQKSLKEVVKAVQNIVIPEAPQVDLKSLEKQQETSNKLLQELIEKPGPTFNTDLPFQDSEGVIKRVTLVDGAVPITGSITASASTLADFSVNDIEEGTTSYFGKTKPDGTYLIQKVTDTSVSYATVTNNGAVTTYTDAWTNRATLTYGRFDQAF